MLQCLEYTRPWDWSQNKRKRKNKEYRLWFTLLRRRLDLSWKPSGWFRCRRMWRFRGPLLCGIQKNISLQKCILWRCVFSNHINDYPLLGRPTIQKQARKPFSVRPAVWNVAHGLMVWTLDPASVIILVGFGTFRRLSLAGGSGLTRDTVHHDGGGLWGSVAQPYFLSTPCFLTECNVTRLFTVLPHSDFPIMLNDVPA